MLILGLSMQEIQFTPHQHSHIKLNWRVLHIFRTFSHNYNKNIFLSDAREIRKRTNHNFNGKNSWNVWTELDWIIATLNCPNYYLINKLLCRIKSVIKSEAMKGRGNTTFHFPYLKADIEVLWIHNYRWNTPTLL